MFMPTIKKVTKTGVETMDLSSLYCGADYGRVVGPGDYTVEISGSK